MDNETDSSEIIGAQGSTIDTIDLNANYNIDFSNMSYTMSPLASPAYGNISISTVGSSGSFLTNSGSNGTSWSTGSTPGIQVKGDAEFEGKVKINGQDIAEFMETISNRLAILVPDPEKLEHFEALQKAYNHYKMLEKLCQLPEKTDDN